MKRKVHQTIAPALIMGIVDKDGNACALFDKECLQKLDLKFPTDTPSSTSSFSFGM